MLTHSGYEAPSSMEEKEGAPNGVSGEGPCFHLMKHSGKGGGGSTIK